ncbi:hypothetical protein BC826DRAFT_933544 [Russula brevipes]|nr:hypothetical protein BC826DRAFT_933544 [Russula brevipes]
MLALLGVVAWALIPFVGQHQSNQPEPCIHWGCGYRRLGTLFQFAVFPRAVDRFGSRRVFATGIAMFAVVYAMFPLENLALRHGSNRFTWLLVFLQMKALIAPCSCMYISAATPSKRPLGATNAIAQLAASIQRTVGPAVADWLFAFSIENNVLDGNFIHIVLFALVGVGVPVAAQLPRLMWAHADRMDPIKMRAFCIGFMSGPNARFAR